MGYTHYFTVGGKVSNKVWKEFTDIVSKLIETSGVIIKDGSGENSPIITKNEVCFNGDEKTDDAHETFSITRGSGIWDFCKTARKPYDVVVVASLIIGKSLGIIKEWSSDGDFEYGDFNDAIELLKPFGEFKIK